MKKSLSSAFFSLFQTKKKKMLSIFFIIIIVSCEKYYSTSCGYKMDKNEVIRIRQTFRDHGSLDKLKNVETKISSSNPIDFIICHESNRSIVDHIIINVDDGVIVFEDFKFDIYYLFVFQSKFDGTNAFIEISKNYEDLSYIPIICGYIVGLFFMFICCIINVIIFLYCWVKNLQEKYVIFGNRSKYELIN